jgi:hypothetical protein
LDFKNSSINSSKAAKLIAKSVKEHLYCYIRIEKSAGGIKLLIIMAATAFNELLSWRD